MSNNSTAEDIIREFNKLYNSTIEKTPAIMKLIKYAYQVGYGEGYESAVTYTDDD